MPTGYNHCVYEKDECSLREYALACAHSFFHDSRIDEPLPEPKPTQYYIDGMAEAERRLATLRTMTVDEADAAAQSDYESRLAAHEECRRHNAEVRARYDGMVALVTSWDVPDSLTGLRTLMLSQIAQCSSEGEDPGPASFVRLGGEEWRRAEIKDTEEGLDYLKAAHQKDIEHVAKVTAWLADLRNALPED